MQAFLLVLLALAVFLLVFAGRTGRWPVSKGESAESAGVRWPAVAVLAPMAGTIPHLDAFLSALHDQDYPDYRIVLIIESARETGTDHQEAAVQIAALERQGLPPQTVVVRAERAVTSGQKSINLIAGLRAAGDVEILATVDADALPHRGWLKSLVAPLMEASAASAAAGKTFPMVASGYRWYVPGRSVPALLRSAFSAGAMSLLTEPRLAFAWGGSLAFHRCDLDRTGIAGLWKSAISDDMAVTRAMRMAGGRVRFVPDCVVPSFGALMWSGLWSFGVRQMVMLYRGGRRLWAVVVAMHLAVAMTQVGAVLAGLGFGALPWGPAGRAAAVALLLCPTILGMARARSRFTELALRPLGRVPGWDERRAAHIVLSPLVAWLTLACLIAAAFQREITWCGIRYRFGERGTVKVLNGPHPAAG